MTTLQTYINAIQVNYPEAGIDNDSQGFRDNFSNIAGGLQKVQDDLAIVQTNAVSVATLDGQNDPVDNNLLGSTIRNGIYNTLRGAVRNGGTINSGVTDIDYNLGVLQTFSINESGVVLRFTNWPDSGEYAKIRIHLRNNGTSTARTVTLSTEGGGTFKFDRTWGSTLLANDGDNYIFGGNVDDGPVCGGTSSSPTIRVETTQKDQIIEAWCYTGNTSKEVYIRHLGEY